MAAGFYIEDDELSIAVSENELRILEAEDLIGDMCADCSSEFSAQAVYHPTDDNDVTGIVARLATLRAKETPCLPH